MIPIELIGRPWLIEQIEGLTDHIDRMTPVEFNEAHRYLPSSVTSQPGPMSFDVNPMIREIVDCFDPDNPTREVSVKKGVQVTYTTGILESVLLFYIAHIRTVPTMFLTADKELATARIENNIIPMLNLSGFGDVFVSSDEGNKRKTGKTAKHLQWQGGGYLIPNGSKNANKFRQFSILLMLKDEIDAWLDTSDGDSDKLSDARCSAYWETRKILRGGTPLLKGSSRIERAYRRGDQRKYMVLCKSCSYPQELRWSGTNADEGFDFGFRWDLTEAGLLVPESVRYACRNCAHDHYEHDKAVLFSTEHGAHWKPTAVPVEEHIRSYHLPALYSPVGMQPWSKSVGDYLEAYDPEKRKVRDVRKFQVFYNNILGEPFEVLGSRVTKQAVSRHRRPEIATGIVPNRYAREHSGGPIMFLTMQVDVHKQNLAVAVMGWTPGARTYLIEYVRLEDDSEEGCENPNSPVWKELTRLIEKQIYESDDGQQYRVVVTLIDARYANALVTDFCAGYTSGVYAIMGVDRPARSARIREFQDFKTQAGVIGFKIVVDHYKDRLAAVLRREWHEVDGIQPEHHFNVPADTPDYQLEELTKEFRREETNKQGTTIYRWHRQGNARNELWDLLVYGHAAVEILAWNVCITQHEMESVDMDFFWRQYERD